MQLECVGVSGKEKPLRVAILVLGKPKPVVLEYISFTEAVRTSPGFGFTAGYGIAPHAVAIPLCQEIGWGRSPGCRGIRSELTLQLTISTVGKLIDPASLDVPPHWPALRHRIRCHHHSVFITRNSGYGNSGYPQWLRLERSEQRVGRPVRWKTGHSA